MSSNGIFGINHFKTIPHREIYKTCTRLLNLKETPFLQFPFFYFFKIK